VIIDATYFIGEIYIAQLGQPEVLESVNRFIAKYEKKFMREFFGYELSEKIYLENETPTDPNIALILNGALITYEGKTFEWVGLKNAAKISPIANYVFFYYTEDLLTNQSGIGQTFNRAENAEVVSPDSKLAFIWNEMIEMLLPLAGLTGENGAWYQWPGPWTWYWPEPWGRFKIINSFNL
jgi:hypothetical protein